MSSEAKIAANRRNARRSTRPSSAAGKARTRYNALRHGLCVPVNQDAETAANIDELFQRWAPWEGPNEEDLAFRAAESHVEMSRVQQAKVEFITKAVNAVEEEDVTPRERAAMGFAQTDGTLAAFDRYEWRLFARRNRALRRLTKLQTAERVGPPLPKEPKKITQFQEQVLRIDIQTIMEQLPKRNTVTRRLDYSTGIGNPIFYVDVYHTNGIGSLTLIHAPHRETVYEKFKIEYHRSHIGNGQWLVQCLQTKRMVRALYYSYRLKCFGSRYALGLNYASASMDASERASERYRALMNRLRAEHPANLPPRPKYMHRKTYYRLRRQIGKAFFKAVGQPVPDIFEDD